MITFRQNENKTMKMFTKVLLRTKKKPTEYKE